MKDYYAVLGVLPSIEQAALKAVYTALMKKYHPDTTNLPKKEAEARAKDINEAYEVLGDPAKRSEYDQQRKDPFSSSGDYGSFSDHPDNSDLQLQKDWELVTAYFPDAENCRIKLRRISITLSETFQILILTEKLSRNAQEVAELLEKEFLQTYFGTNKLLHPFVLFLIQGNAKEALLEINNYIRVIGTPNNNEVSALVEKVIKRFNIKNYPRLIKPDDIHTLYGAIYPIMNPLKKRIENHYLYLAKMTNGTSIGMNPHSGKYEIFDSFKHYGDQTDVTVGKFYEIKEDLKEATKDFLDQINAQGGLK